MTRIIKVFIEIPRPTCISRIFLTQLASNFSPRQVLDCKLGRGRVLSEKELVKLEGKRKKSESAVRKADLDYYACCLKAERTRSV